MASVGTGDGAGTWGVVDAGDNDVAFSAKATREVTRLYTLARVRKGTGPPCPILYPPGDPQHENPQISKTKAGHDSRYKRRPVSS